MKKLMAIDPGTTESGWVEVEHDGKTIIRVLDKGKSRNEEILRRLYYMVGTHDIAIEMVASYGMPVGREVFETCVWIGRFLQAAAILPGHTAEHLVYRMEEKSRICHSGKANDSTIRHALVDMFAPGQKNYGKGTKKAPGFFYGFGEDVWQAMAVAVTWVDRQKGDKC